MSYVLREFANHRFYSHTAVSPDKASALSLHPSRGRAVDTAHGCRMDSPLLCLRYWASEDHDPTCGLFDLPWPILSLHGVARRAWRRGTRGATHCSAQAQILGAREKPGETKACGKSSWWWLLLLEGVDEGTGGKIQADIKGKELPGKVIPLRFLSHLPRSDKPSSPYVSNSS